MMPRLEVHPREQASRKNSNNIKTFLFTENPPYSEKIKDRVKPTIQQRTQKNQNLSRKASAVFSTRPVC
jgi:hypothetical protein